MAIKFLTISVLWWQFAVSTMVLFIWVHQWASAVWLTQSVKHILQFRGIKTSTCHLHLIKKYVSFFTSFFCFVPSFSHSFLSRLSLILLFLPLHFASYVHSLSSLCLLVPSDSFPLWLSSNLSFFLFRHLPLFHVSPTPLSHPISCCCGG